MRQKRRYGMAVFLLCAFSQMTFGQSDCDPGVRFKPSTLSQYRLACATFA